MPHGTVQRCDADTGTGSVAPDDGTAEISFRTSPEACAGGRITEGRRVAYRAGQGPDGPAAEDLRPLDADDRALELAAVGAAAGEPARAEPGGSRPERRGSDYAVLSREVKAAGLLNRRPLSYAVRIGVNLLLLAAGWTAFALIGASWWQLLTAAFLGIVFTQTAFLGHDAGHQQISSSKRVNDFIGRVHGDLLVGLSYGWWNSKHNRHHAHPNQVERDPDIAGNAIAFTEEQTRARTGVGVWVARRQAWLFFPMLLLEGLNLHVSSVRALFGSTAATRGTKLAEAVLLTAHLGGYLAAVFVVLSPLQAVAFIAVHQGLFGLYMGCSFAPNHKGMPIIAKGEKIDFLRRQVLTSRNIRGGRFTDVALGGLNYQVEHHLFPSMPRSALPRVQPMVREFCARHGIEYYETGLVESYRQVLRHLNTVGGGSLRPDLEY
ncbi:fatty acid desaturase [Streptomonospora salina]|uniref:Fatty acid desaturase/cold shock CspA family protein n=1 Tax=Streptomonospora salina TaxID=104205 RepID=A0A841E9Y4_9ACTN|nr:fatty acid desaturase [Streptomonospora salina]MBB5999812.1 fatty acid desaturase/cold shock CspA family protein [Streptomonospora salina]